ncbi:PREDICTED: putative F-box protein At5g15660 [Nicotiana attenuata]|uniref:F-box protein n=1 Tax=Nicotiana attenuata TaxID=49451 RepID=A0A1J6IV52_NICAT|nr:PREDICTED: putative F-box protein At5g15660 [Nicotiana attenuata]OIT01591.1 f-box protein [Nicotiana attenuata]
MAMGNYFLEFLILMAPFIVIWRSTTVNKPKNLTVSSSSQRDVNFTDLPFDIIINIINRLPFKSLFQICLVSRSWRSLLSMPEIAIHINVVSQKNYTLLSYNDVTSPSDVIWKFKIPIELLSLEYVLLKPVNGILCICGPLYSHVSYVYLWNPLTKEFKALPRPKIHMGYVAFDFGFGFVPKTNDYKVLRIVSHERKPDSWIHEIYSLNRNSWRRVQKSCSDIFVTINLEKEVIIEVGLSNRRREHSEEITTWRNEMDNAMSLTYPEDGLALCHSKYGQQYWRGYKSYSTRKFAFAGSLVSLNRNYDSLG